MGLCLSFLFPFLFVFVLINQPLRLFLGLMIHSCHGLKPHDIMLRPDLQITTALDKLNRADSEDQDLHLNFLLTQWDQKQTYTACLFKKCNVQCCVGVYVCILSHAGVWRLLQAFPSSVGVCVGVCAHVRVRGRKEEGKGCSHCYKHRSCKFSIRPKTPEFFCISFVI